ncbi:RNA pyrophosphohydrolase [Aurantiacibacter rhizosphaerae]|uniref:RNA pyrophosphohydrolase n=1 Tax=Aurantiacibacter rhizosphaerae TaxID=2691582 RepID=A0A844XEW0_9SPHN|nr:RNA pyrophosphohydrolase [Aurantiacibacter rhizosphaerae]MWV28202.1 RNA pyrophosphohydrolase [Aurantiacibacter rhizosphaerae]
MTRTDRLQYRPCVGTMIINSAGEAFVGKRIDNKEGDWWQMPQGGVDEGEDLDEAMLREVEEETGVTASHLQIVHRLEDELYYDLPAELQGKLWKGKYKGQRQVWYLVRFTGADSNIDLEAHKHPEFCEWKWVDPDLLPELIVPFKREIYETVVAGFKGKI